MKNVDSNSKQSKNINVLDVFPYKVYEDFGMPMPDSEGTLKFLEAGFMELADAEFYIYQKSMKTKKKYILECCNTAE